VTPTTFHAILVPLDGSAAGEQAIPVGARIARRAGATLHFAMACEPSPARPLSSELPRVAEAVEREARIREAGYLETVAEAARSTHGLSVTTALLEGPAASALAEHVRACRIGLVVMTTHGRGGLSRWWLGSVTDRLLRRTPVPLLLLHPRLIDRAAANRHRIPYTHTPDVLTDATAEYAFFMMGAVARKLYPAEQQVRAS